MVSLCEDPVEYRLSSNWHKKWVSKMLGYDFQIIYIKGNKSVVVDALTRKHEDVDALLCVVSIIQLMSRN